MIENTVQILIASNNTHKIKELQQIMDSLNLPVTFIPQNSIINLDIEENGYTLEENAWIKAHTLHTLTGMPVLADDTGLEITALNKRPGVYSARYAGIHGDDAANRAKVLQEMADMDDHSAQFRTVLCYQDMQRVIFAEGICPGTILMEEIGSGGFGYDSIFMPVGMQESFAQMDTALKNQISHRYRAAHAMALSLQQYIQDINTGNTAE
jgi:XTP/dITP diphosphohydrolase